MRNDAQLCDSQPPAGERTGRLRVALCISAAITALVFAPGSAASATSLSHSTRVESVGTQLELYAVLSRSEYIDMADDRTRGEGNNPFGNYASSSLPAPSDENPYGPLGGDEGDFTFTLYTSASRKTQAGTAVYICQYNFDKNGLCSAAFTLKDGTLIAKGTSNFASTTFSFAILGGTYAYRSTKGVATVTALGPATQGQPVFRSVPMLQAERIILTVRPA